LQCRVRIRKDFKKNKRIKNAYRKSEKTRLAVTDEDIDPKHRKENQYTGHYKVYACY